MSYTDVPEELVIYPDTDEEGEPRIKTAFELWPLPEHDSSENSALSDEGSSTTSSASTRAPLSARFAGARAAPRGRRCRPTKGARAPIDQGFGTCDNAGIRGRATQRSIVSDRGAGGEGRARAADCVTTLAVRNLAKNTTVQELLSEIDRSGFTGAYDFAYRQEGRHYAFVNFKTPEIALAFAVAWHGTRRLGLAPGATTLSVEAASVQGLHANAAKWTVAKGGRAKNPAKMPFISEEASPTDMVTTLVVQKLPKRLIQQKFLDEVNSCGFDGKYDVAYLPAATTRASAVATLS